EGRHAEHIVIGHRVVVLCAKDPEGPPAGDFGEDLVGIGTVHPQAVADDSRLPNIPALVVAGGEEGPLDGGEHLGLSVPYGDASLHGKKVGCLGGVIPDVGVALGVVDLVEGERNPGHIPVGTSVQSGEDVFGGVSREGTAVVPRHSERNSHVWPFSYQLTPARPLSSSQSTARRSRAGRRLLAPLPFVLATTGSVRSAPGAGSAGRRQRGARAAVRRVRCRRAESRLRRLAHRAS